MNHPQKTGRIQMSSYRCGRVAVREFGWMILAVVVVLFGTRQMMLFLTDTGASRQSSKCATDRGVNRLSIDRDGHQLWVCRHLDSIEKINLSTGETETSQSIQGMELNSVSVSSNERTVLYCPTNGQIELLHDGKILKISEPLPIEQTLVGSAVSDQGDVAVVVTSTARVLGWIEQNTGMIAFAYQLPQVSPVKRMQLSDSGHQFSILRFDGMLTTHDVETGILIGEPLRVGSECDAFAYRADHGLVAVVTNDARVRVYDKSTAQIVAEGLLDETMDYVRTIALAVEFSPDAKRLAITVISSIDVHVWDIGTCKLAGKLHGHKGLIRDVRFSPDTNRIYSGSYDGTVREWSLETWSQLRSFE